jgi:hypothetical protein
MDTEILEKKRECLEKQLQSASYAKERALQHLMLNEEEAKTDEFIA